MTQIHGFSTKGTRHLSRGNVYPNHRLCDTCSQLDFRKLFRDGIGNTILSSDSAANREMEEEEENDDEHRVQLGFIDEIAKRSDCPSCRLVTHVVRIGLPTILEPDFHSKTEDVDRISCTLGSSLGHEMNEWPKQDNAGPSAIWLNIVLDINHRHLKLRRGLVLDVEQTTPGRMRGSSPLTPFYSGRAINPDRVDFNIVKSWLETCKTIHTYRCGHVSPANPPGLPHFRVIDVVSRTVVDAPPACRYVALSYVVGPPSYGKSMFRLRRANSAGQDTSSIKLPPSLPRTFEDSMAVVREIGERYLWVDALCIFDDDAQDKKTHISSMADVYGRSLCTIVAAHGEDADAGLVGVRPNTRIGEPQYSEVVDGLRIYVSLPELTEELFKVEQMSLGEYLSESDEDDDYDSGLVNALTPVGWVSRAWTMQEGLLSPSCLFFTKSQAHWVCSAEQCSESIAEPPMKQRFMLKPTSWAATISSPMIGLTADDSDLQEIRDGTHFTTYSGLIEEYSKRELTFQHDKLDAVEGMFTAFKARFGPAVLWGIPEDFFDLALLWRFLRGSSLDRGLPRNTDLFPSWSWASWPSEVSYERERRIEFSTLALHAKPLNSYFKETVDGRRAPILQLMDDATPAPSSPSTHPPVAYSPFLHFEASTARFKIFNTRLPWSRILTDPPCHIDPQMDFGVDIWIDDARDQKRLHGTECDFVALSTWHDELARADNEFHPDAYRGPVYNVMCVEWRDGVAYRLGVGSIKTQLWERAGPVRRAIKLG